MKGIEIRAWEEGRTVMNAWNEMMVENSDSRFTKKDFFQLYVRTIPDVVQYNTIVTVYRLMYLVNIFCGHFKKGGAICIPIQKR